MEGLASALAGAESEGDGRADVETDGAAERVNSGVCDGSREGDGVELALGVGESAGEPLSCAEDEVVGDAVAVTVSEVPTDGDDVAEAAALIVSNRLLRVGERDAAPAVADTDRVRATEGVPDVEPLRRGVSLGALDSVGLAEALLDARALAETDAEPLGLRDAEPVTDVDREAEGERVLDALEAAVADCEELPDADAPTEGEAPGLREAVPVTQARGVRLLSADAELLGESEAVGMGLSVLNVLSDGVTVAVREASALFVELPTGVSVRAADRDSLADDEGQGDGEADALRRGDAVPAELPDVRPDDDALIDAELVGDGVAVWQPDAAAVCVADDDSGAVREPVANALPLAVDCSEGAGVGDAVPEAEGDADAVGDCDAPPLREGLCEALASPDEEAVDDTERVLRVLRDSVAECVAVRMALLEGLDRVVVVALSLREAESVDTAVAGADAVDDAVGAGEREGGGERDCRDETDGLPESDGESVTDGVGVRVAAATDAVAPCSDADTECVDALDAAGEAELHILAGAVKDALRVAAALEDCDAVCVRGAESVDDRRGDALPENSAEFEGDWLVEADARKESDGECEARSDGDARDDTEEDAVSDPPPSALDGLGDIEELAVSDMLASVEAEKDGDGENDAETDTVREPRDEDVAEPLRHAVADAVGDGDEVDLPDTVIVEEAQAESDEGADAVAELAADKEGEPDSDGDAEPDAASVTDAGGEAEPDDVRDPSAESVRTALGLENIVLPVADSVASVDSVGEEDTVVDGVADAHRVRRALGETEGLTSAVLVAEALDVEERVPRRGEKKGDAEDVAESDGADDSDGVELFDASSVGLRIASVFDGRGA